MNKQLGKSTIKKSADYYGKVVKALVDAGFVNILSTETTTGFHIVGTVSIDEEIPPMIELELKLDHESHGNRASRKKAER